MWLVPKKILLSAVFTKIKFAWFSRWSHLNWGWTVFYNQIVGILRSVSKSTDVPFSSLKKKKGGWLSNFTQVYPSPPVRSPSCPPVPCETQFCLSVGEESFTFVNFAPVSLPWELGMGWQPHTSSSYPPALPSHCAPLSYFRPLLSKTCCSPLSLPSPPHSTASLGSSRLILKANIHRCFLHPLPKLVQKLRELLVAFKIPNPLMQERAIAI